ncbi:MAG: cytochrome c-type biogenesis protein CcmH, partial [Gammaproteobacteria bacterium]
MTASTLIYLFLFSMSNGLNAEAVYMFDDASEEKRFYSLISEIRCPKCTSGSIASSEVPVSRDLK